MPRRYGGSCSARLGCPGWIAVSFIVTVVLPLISHPWCLWVTTRWGQLSQQAKRSSTWQTLVEVCEFKIRVRVMQRASVSNKVETLERCTKEQNERAGVLQS